MCYCDALVIFGEFRALRKRNKRPPLLKWHIYCQTYNNSHVYIMLYLIDVKLLFISRHSQINTDIIHYRQIQLLRPFWSTCGRLWVILFFTNNSVSLPAYTFLHKLQTLREEVFCKRRFMSCFYFCSPRWLVIHLP